MTDQELINHLEGMMDSLDDHVTHEAIHEQLGEALKLARPDYAVDYREGPTGIFVNGVEVSAPQLKDDLATPDPLQEEIYVAQANYSGQLPQRLTIGQRVQRRMGFSDGYRARAGQEVGSGVVRVSISPETVDRCAQALYERLLEENGAVGVMPAWEVVDGAAKGPFIRDVLAVFAVLPMQP